MVRCSTDSANMCVGIGSSYALRLTVNSNGYPFGRDRGDLPYKPPDISNPEQVREMVEHYLDDYGSMEDHRSAPRKLRCLRGVQRLPRDLDEAQQTTTTRHQTTVTSVIISSGQDNLILTPCPQRVDNMCEQRTTRPTSKTDGQQSVSTKVTYRELHTSKADCLPCCSANFPPTRPLSISSKPGPRSWHHLSWLDYFYIQSCDNETSRHALIKGVGKHQPLHCLVAAHCTWHNRQGLSHRL